MSDPSRGVGLRMSPGRSRTGSRNSTVARVLRTRSSSVVRASRRARRRTMCVGRTTDPDVARESRGFCTPRFVPPDGLSSRFLSFHLHTGRNKTVPPRGCARKAAVDGAVRRGSYWESRSPTHRQRRGHPSRYRNDRRHRAGHHPGQRRSSHRVAGDPHPKSCVGGRTPVQDPADAGNSLGRRTAASPPPSARSAELSCASGGVKLSSS